MCVLSVKVSTNRSLLGCCFVDSKGWRVLVWFVVGYDRTKYHPIKFFSTPFSFMIIVWTPKGYISCSYVPKYIVQNSNVVDCFLSSNITFLIFLVSYVSYPFVSICFRDSFKISTYICVQNNVLFVHSSYIVST